MTLSEFLLERIAEDEATAYAASPSPWSYPGIESVAGGMLYDKTRTIANVVYEQPNDHDGRIARHLLVPEADANGAHIARHDPARVLAECEAKRSVLKIHARLADSPEDERYETDHDSWMRDSCVGCNWGGPCDDYHVGHVDECPTLRALATTYADHADYRAEWRS